MHVVDVVLVRDCHMTATRLVLVRMVGVLDVLGGIALIEVAVVRAMEVCVVHVVSVVLMRNGDVAAAFVMLMLMSGMFSVFSGRSHDSSSDVASPESPAWTYQSPYLAAKIQPS